MRRIAKSRREAKKLFEGVCGEEWLARELEEVMAEGKRALDGCVVEVGRMLVEVMMQAQRVQMTGMEYQPAEVGVKKWGWQPGSVYVGPQKLKVEHPRMRGEEGEILLPVYERLKKPGEFSEEMLVRAMRGMSGRKYRETVEEISEGFGISPSTISKRLVEATAEKLRRLRERDLSDFEAFAIFLDTVHRGKAAFTVALGIDVSGKKRVLGFWEGATENREVAASLLSDMESRGLQLTAEIIFVTDGGGGIIRALKDRLGDDLMHQRCTIHKDRNLQRHLPKRYRKECHRRFRQALALKDYSEARKALNELEAWLAEINESAAESLREAKEQLLTLHRLEMPALLRRTLHSTNPIESMFATVRDSEGNVKRYRSSKMSRRWLGAVLIYAEEGFKLVKGYRQIPEVLDRIRRFQSQEIELAAA
jgi:transposase-like protein